MNIHYQAGTGKLRIGLFSHNYKLWKILKYNDVTILNLGVLQIGWLTGRNCHGDHI